MCPTVAARGLLGIIVNDPSHVLAISPFILAEVGKALSYPDMPKPKRLGLSSPLPPPRLATVHAAFSSPISLKTNHLS
jgi:hypothetical protein